MRSSDSFLAIGCDSVTRCGPRRRALRAISAGRAALFLAARSKEFRDL